MAPATASAMATWPGRASPPPGRAAVTSARASRTSLPLTTATVPLSPGPGADRFDPFIRSAAVVGSWQLVSPDVRTREAEAGVSAQGPGNWYADPTGRYQQRYHDGSGWTPHVVTLQGE